MAKTAGFINNAPKTTSHLMYDVALSVLSCLNSDTEVHVAWTVSGSMEPSDEAVAITPGGGRMGSLLGGALDHAVVEAIPGLPNGGLLEIVVGPVEALVAGLSEGETITLAILPGSALPADIWEDIAARRAVGFALRVDGVSLSDPERLETDEPGSILTSDRLVTSLVPVPHILISGSGPIADALAEVFAVIGWRTSVVGEVGAATGMMATLAAIDGVIVMGHDVEQSGQALQGAIGSNAGYIGSLGAERMQALRREWLAYRGVEWDERIHGPAGLPIGASNPGEIAVSIAAEAVAALRGMPDDPSELS